MRPHVAESPSKASVLAACLRADRLTVRGIANATGLSVSHTHFYLRQLREDGMVDWDQGRTGSLRLTCRPAPVSERVFDILESSTYECAGHRANGPGTGHQECDSQ